MPSGTQLDDLVLNSKVLAEATEARLKRESETVYPANYYEMVAQAKKCPDCKNVLLHAWVNDMRDRVDQAVIQ